MPAFLRCLWRRWADACSLIVNGPRIPHYETDAEALAADWQAVGDDMRAAVQKTIEEDADALRR